MLRFLIHLSLLLTLFTSLSLCQTLHTSDRYILNSRNQRVRLRCVNWAGHGETNIPEGLHAQPLSHITSWIASNGFNCVRLTYSIDMALNPHEPVYQSFNNAADGTGLGKNLTDLFKKAAVKNPWLLVATTRSTYAAVIASLGARGVMVVLDNHNSKAGWCCSTTDGNGWWKEASGYVEANSRNFAVQDWVNGLSAMAKFGKTFPNVVGYSLRNELRTVQGQNNADWYEFVAKGALAVHQADPEGLVVIGGINYALDLGFLREKNFDRQRLGIEKKTVWEFHTYSWSNSQTANCSGYAPILDSAAGFLLESNKPYTGPLILSEFGWAQDGPTQGEQAYYDCLVGWVEEKDVGWAYWALQGSYYIREGRVDYDETFGLLSRDWKDWRNESFVDVLGGLWT
ncbi:glycosyl hydrolase family 5 protein/cellulase [Leptodontidium sp. 2 PMI_412]|nr:glycosyl hydrolase family 5 protein/cellulase [Leptodontidium sp. 2 PMI_412]